MKWSQMNWFQLSAHHMQEKPDLGFHYQTSEFIV